jgi:hypothetical protein
MIETGDKGCQGNDEPESVKDELLRAGLSFIVAASLITVFKLHR